MVSRNYYLTPVLGGPGAPRYPVAEEPQIIGRSEEADIALLEPTVSRRHASVRQNDGLIWLEDLGSKHGTFVNSKRISSTKLKLGDIVVFGLSLVLRLEESEEPVPPAIPLKVPGMFHGPIGTVDVPDVTAIRPMPSAEAAVAGRARDHRSSHTRETGPVQDQLVRARKLAGAGAFCITVLPEVQARLAEICAMLRQASGETLRLPDPTQLLAALEPVNAAVERMVDATLSLPRQQLSATSLGEVIQRAVAGVSAAVATRGISFRSDIVADLVVGTDPHRLVAALSKLLRSVCQSCPDKGIVEITGTASGEGGLLTISGEGAELSEEALQRAFDPIVTRGSDWKPLGLPVFEARQIIMSLGGTVSVRPRPGGGLLVRVVLAAAPR